MLRNVNLKVSTSKNNLPKLEAALKLLQREEVLVGVPEEETNRDSADSSISNAALLYLNDTGSPAQNIPARPVMDPGIKDAKPKMLPHMKDIGQGALENANPHAVHQGLEAVALIAQNSVRSRINTGPFVPLKPATIKARKRRGHTSEKPLVESGQMRNAVVGIVRSTK